MKERRCTAALERFCCAYLFVCVVNECGMFVCVVNECRMFVCVVNECGMCPYSVCVDNVCRKYVLNECRMCLQSVCVVVNKWPK
jgi:hypothetical protein